MAATALIKFTQNAVTGPDGQAYRGLKGHTATLENSDNTDVASWDVFLVYVPPGSALVASQLVPFAFSNNSSTPVANFSPDVEGCYRFNLVVYESIGRTGTSDQDIRNFGIPELRHGFIRPPYQKLPDPLPVLGSGDVGEKPDELNFEGQVFGWAGGSSDGLMHDILGQLDNSTFDLLPDPLSVAAIDTNVPNVIEIDYEPSPVGTITDGTDVYVLFSNGSNTALGPGVGRISLSTSNLLERVLTGTLDNFFAGFTYLSGKIWCSGADTSVPDAILQEFTASPLTAGAVNIIQGGHFGTDITNDGADLWYLSDDTLFQINPATPATPTASTLVVTGGFCLDVEYDPDTTNYGDSQPRFWVGETADPLTTDTFLYRIDPTGPTVDGSLVITGGSSFTLNAIAVGGGFIWLALVVSSTWTIVRVTPDPVGISLSSTSISAVFSAIGDNVWGIVYDPVNAKIWVHGDDLGSGPGDVKLVRVDPTTLAVETTVTITPVGGFANDTTQPIRALIFAGSLWSTANNAADLGEVNRVDPVGLGVTTMATTKDVAWDRPAIAETAVTGTVDTGGEHEVLMTSPAGAAWEVRNFAYRVRNILASLSWDGEVDHYAVTTTSAVIIDLIDDGIRNIGKQLRVSDVSGGAATFNITVRPPSGREIRDTDGTAYTNASPLVLSSAYESITIVQFNSGSTNTWIVVARSAGGAASGSAGGDLSATYPNPTVAGLQTRALSASAPTPGNAIQWSGSQWEPSFVNLAEIRIAQEVIASDVTMNATAALKLISTAAARSVTLNSGWPTNALTIVKDNTGSGASNNITVNAPGGHTIDGVGSKIIATDWGSLSFIRTGGTTWRVV